MYTIGTDPEMFVMNQNSGELMPVCGKLGGTKGAAKMIADGIGLQEDNVMVEFNILPQTNPTDFCTAVVRARDRVLMYVKANMPESTLFRYPEAHFSKKLLSHPQAMTFGCSPDFDAYQHGQACAPVDPSSLEEGDGQWRFAGGHVHMGYQAELPEFVAASFADIFLGLWAVRHDHQPLRRRLYGQPGRYRPTPYGIEYRTLSNFWVINGENYARVVGERTLALCKYLSETPVTTIRGHFKEIPWADVQQAITQEDSKLAGALARHVSKQFGIGGDYAANA